MAEARIQIILSDGKKAGETLKELGKDANRINKELKDLKPGTEQFIAKSKDLQQVNARMKEVKELISGTTEASNILKDSFNKYVPFSGMFNKVGQELGFVKKGVGGLTGSLGILRTALVATGIGAIVVILGTLISYLTTTQSGMDKVTAVTRPLAAIFQRLIGVAQELGEKVFKRLSAAVNDPRQAFIDLGNAIKENIIARFEALALFGPAIAKIFKGEFAEGFKELGNATIQVTTGVKDGIDKIISATEDLKGFVSEAIDQGSKLDQLQKNIERAEINQIQRSKELELIIKQQKDIVEDISKSYDERRAAAEKALQAQQALLQGEGNLLDQRIAKLRLQHSLNDTSREDEKELAELIAKKLEIEARVTEQSIEFKKKLGEFDKAQAAEQLALQKNLESLRVEAMQEGIEKEIAQIELNTEQKIEALKGSAEQILEQEKLLEEIRQNEIQAVKDKYAAEAAARDKKAKEEQEKRDKELAEKQKKIAEEKAAFEAAMDELHRDIALDSFAFATDLSAKTLKDEEAAKKVRKAGALVEIGINLQRELSANAAHAATLGPAGLLTYLPAANLRAIIRAGISAARVIAFRKGGVLKGPSHENRGIPFTIDGRHGFEAEGDEILLTKGVYRNPFLRRAASAINVLGGGRQFATGGPLSPFTDRAPVPRSATSGSGSASSILGLDTLSAKMDQLIEAQNRRIDRLKVINVATETEDVIKTINQIRDEADV